MWPVYSSGVIGFAHILCDEWTLHQVEKLVSGLLEILILGELKLCFG
jgi:hypothetical protein